MMYINIWAIFTVFAFSANAGENLLHFKKQLPISGPDDWTELRVTYNPDKNAKWAFNKLPFTRREAEKAGWKEVGCNKCSGVGYKYILNDDPAVVPIYAENGQLVGLQNGIPESKLNSDKLIAWFKQQPMYQTEHPSYNNSDTLYTSTVYFSDPDHICDKDFKYIHNLFFMNGTQKVSLPTDECKIDPAWVKGKCTPGKGMHYFYKLVKDFDCNNWQPFFPLYNNGKLVAFSFASFGEFQMTSNRYGPSEYHPSDSYAEYANAVPACTFTFGHNLTSLHGYLIKNPWDIKC